MKNIYRTIAMCLLAAAISVSGLSCKKKEPAAPPLTPEQKARTEMIKKGAEEAKKVFAAQVNGVEISMYELIREMNKIAPKYVKEGEQSTPKITEKIRKEALDNVIFNELAVQEAIRQGISVSPERINQVVELMKEQTGSKEAYQEYLDGLGITEDVLRKRIERSHLLELVTAKEVYQKITIDERAARAEYQKNKNDYRDKSGQKLSYDEVSMMIKKKMVSEIGVEKKKEWGAALRKNAKIVIAKDAGK